MFQRFFDSAIESKGAFAIVDRKTAEIIGSSRYYKYNPIENAVTIGFTFLARAYWGGVYNGELKQLMLDHAFQFVDHVLFEVGAGNMRSRGALEKIGAKFLYNFDLRDGSGDAIPCVAYGIERKIRP